MNEGVADDKVEGTIDDAMLGLPDEDAEGTLLLMTVGSSEKAKDGFDDVLNKAGIVGKRVAS